MKSFCLVLFLSLACIFSVQAQDEGLYPDPPPADAAFVRVIHGFADTEASSHPLSLTLGDVDFPEINFAEATDYYVVLQGEHTMQLKSDTFNLSQEVEILAGHFYSVAVTANAASDDDQASPASLTLLEDPLNTNRAKTLLVLSNVSAAEVVDLKTADGSVDVLLGVEPFSNASIPVNPIQVDLATFVDGEVVTMFEGLVLERGAIYTTIVLDGNEGQEAIWVLTETVLEE